ncbi:uncharacterized protein [Ambystoma mexicanum]|uniref:uncharacterized protein isoform X1 n=1 Tax=Ambystoma mexicanum TaxID=8296 RepID=UPI0037E7B1E1
MAKPKAGTLLFVLGKDNVCKVGLPPSSANDNFHKRAHHVGTLENVSMCFFSPEGKLFVVRGGELYKGPMPSIATKNWFDDAKRIGRSGWDIFKFLLFSPGGKLYAVTKEGKFFCGAEPKNEHVPWLDKEAEEIGVRGFQKFSSFFFDHEEMLYGILEKQIMKSYPVTPYGTWIVHSTNVGKRYWDEYTHFNGVSYDGNMWAVHNTGVLYSAPPPTFSDDGWVERAQNLGSDYLNYKVMAFAPDKTIAEIVSIDFLPELGKVLSKETVLVKEQLYDNKNGTSTLKATFKVDDKLTADSCFSHEHGYEMDCQAVTTFETGVPLVSEDSILLSTSASSRHTWNLIGINKVTTKVVMSQEFEVEPGKCFLRKAIANKAVIQIPYCAHIKTIFGYETTIGGTWNGTAFYKVQFQNLLQ